MVLRDDQFPQLAQNIMAVKDAHPSAVPYNNVTCSRTTFEDGWFNLIPFIQHLRTAVGDVNQKSFTWLPECDLHDAYDVTITGPSWFAILHHAESIIEEDNGQDPEPRIAKDKAANPTDWNKLSLAVKQSVYEASLKIFSPPREILANNRLVVDPANAPPRKKLIYNFTTDGIAASLKFEKPLVEMADGNDGAVEDSSTFHQNKRFAKPSTEAEMLADTNTALHNARLLPRFARHSDEEILELITVGVDPGFSTAVSFFSKNIVLPQTKRSFIKRGVNRRRQDRHGRRSRRRRRSEFWSTSRRKRRKCGGKPVFNRRKQSATHDAISNAYFVVLSGSKIASKCHEKLLKNHPVPLHPPLVGSLWVAKGMPEAALPEAGVLSVTFLNYLARIRFLIDTLLLPCLEHIMIRKVRRISFQSHMRRQSAIEIVAKRIVGGLGKAGLVLYGNYVGKDDGQTAGPGNVKIPHDAIVKAITDKTGARVIRISEEMSSQRCSNHTDVNQILRVSSDATFLTPVMVETRDRVSREATGGTHACIRLKKCAQCNTVWNRDVNASMNFQKMFIHMWRNQHNGWQRPDAYLTVAALRERNRDRDAAAALLALAGEDIVPLVLAPAPVMP